MDYLGLLERASEPGPGPTRRQPGSVMVPGPLASALASELSRCHAGPGALPGTPGHTRASLTVFLWLKCLIVHKREQSAAASDGPCLRSLSSWPRTQHEESVQCYSLILSIFTAWQADVGHRRMQPVPLPTD